MSSSSKIVHNKKVVVRYMDASTQTPPAQVFPLPETNPRDAVMKEDALIRKQKRSDALRSVIKKQKPKHVEIVNRAKVSSAHHQKRRVKTQNSKPSVRSLFSPSPPSSPSRDMQNLIIDESIRSPSRPSTLPSSSSTSANNQDEDKMLQSDNE